MKFIKYTDKGRLDKYVSERAVITFMRGQNKIFVVKRKHNGKREYINQLLNNGYKRIVKAG